MLDTDLTSLLSSSDLSVLFDRDWYRLQNADVIDAETDPLAHYIAIGSTEGLDPHPLFDTSWYLERNPDVAAASMNPLAHYIAYGATEGRDPHPLFDTSWYLQHNPDVTGADKNPLAHYIAYGAAEGRNPHPLFDSAWYFAKYPDVAAARENPLSHYIHVGVHYGTEPHPFFNGAWYRRAHDLPTLVGIGPLIHFIDSGAAANLDPSPYFSMSWYRSRYLSDAPETINPLVHFVCGGQASGYSPLPLMSLHRSRLFAENELFQADAADVSRHLSVMVVRPHFYIYINSDDQICPALISIREQSYKRFTIIRDDYFSGRADDNKYLPTDEYVIWLEPGDRLHRRALYRFASAINQYGSADAFYGDEEIDASDRRSAIPFYKPRWSPTYLENFNYIGRSACYKASLLKDILPKIENGYAFNLQMTSRSSNVIHIRKNIVRSHDRRIAADQETSGYKTTLEDHFRSTGRMGSVRQHDARYNSFCFDPAHADPGSLSIVLYAAGHAALREEKLVGALQSLLPDLRNVGLEIIVVSEHPDDDAELARKGEAACEMHARAILKFMTWNHFVNEFEDFSAKSVLFVNVDVCALSKDWLRHTFKHFMSPNVAAVGAEIRCAPSQNRYAGLVFKNSMPRYVRSIACDTAIEYFFAQSAARNYRAVSPAFMLVRAEIYGSIKKNYAALGVQFSLIDYCLRCEDENRSIVYDPTVQIECADSDLQMALDTDSAGIAFYDVWQTRNFADPYYNEEFLSIDPPHYEGRFSLDQYGSLRLR